MSKTFKVKGTGEDAKKAIDKLMASMKNAAKSRVVAGLPSSSAPYPETGESVVTIGVIHEFGSPSMNIPERSFLRSTSRENRSAYIKGLVTVSSKAFKDGNLDSAKLTQGLGLIGRKMQDDIQSKIDTGPFAPNSEYTIAMKGSSKPLIDTGHLRQSIRYEVRKGKSE